MPPRSKRDPRVITALLRPQLGKEEEFRQTLEGLTEVVRRDPACLECLLTRDLGGSERYVLVMVWQDLASLEAHLASESFHVLLGAVQVLTSPRDVRFLASPGGYLPPPAHTFWTSAV